MTTPSARNWGGTDGRLWPVVLAGWLFAALVLLITNAGAIAARRFPDADDAMRLLQVRDWLAGQGWFDVAQHRLNHGDFPMHWSRLVDVPIAATILLLRPLLGAATAESVALVVVPLLTLLLAMGLIAAITRRVAGPASLPAAVVLVALSAPVLAQMRPLRIDHHGWQIVLALVALMALLGRQDARRGALLGLALASLLTVSLEGLPIAVAIAAVAVLGWAWDGRERPGATPFVLAFGATLPGAAVLLHGATRGPGFALIACDAMSPVWLAALGCAVAGLGLAVVVARFGLIARLIALAAGGGAALIAIRSIAPICLAGPFATLPAPVYRYWYLTVLEGQPLWLQSPAWAVITIGLPVVGLCGAIIAWRAAAGEPRRRWTQLIAVQAAALAVAVMVNRAGATANAVAVPGAAVLLYALLTRARRIEATVPRVVATLAALLFASPGQVAGIGMLLVSADHSPDRPAGRSRPICHDTGEMAALRALPRGTVFAPIDATPSLLVATPHRAIAGGYHRGALAMERVMIAFMASPAHARGIVLASGADYLAVCPGMNELHLYRRVAPNGLWARLDRGEPVAWLRPVALPGHALAWRVIRPADTAAPLP